MRRFPFRRPASILAFQSRSEFYGVTVNVVVLLMPPNFALMVVLPFATAVAKPPALIVATAGLEEVHATLPVMS